MAAVKYKFKVEQGSTFRDSFIWKIKNPESGLFEPVDMTGCTARMQVRTSTTASTVVIELTSVNGRISLGSEGQIDFYLDDAETAALPVGAFVYDLEIVFPAVGAARADVERKLKGTFIVDPEVTR